MMQQGSVQPSQDPSPLPEGSGSGTCPGLCKQTPSETSPESLHMSVLHSLPTQVEEERREEVEEGRNTLTLK